MDNLDEKNLKTYYYKGFNKGLKCRGFQYKEGETFTHKGNISLCTKGFHFCEKISDVFNFYKKNFETHEYAIVEALGEIKKTNDKCVTDVLKIVRVLTPQEVLKIELNEKKEYYENDIFCLDVLRELQKKYVFSIGGSCALFLQNIILDRRSNEIDFDIIMPYYQKIVADPDSTDGSDDDRLIDEVEEFDAKSSGNDFSRTYCLTTKDGRFLKLDVRIKPEQPYEVVKYNEHNYKVCDILTILEAKIRYAIDGNKKHKRDIMNMLNFPNKKDTKTFDISNLF
jgi:hypothetical protein